MPRQQLQHHHDGVDIRHRRTHGDEHVHVGRAVAQRLVRAGVILPADVKLHRRRQGKHQQDRPRLLHPHHRQDAEIQSHREQEQRDGENQPGDEQTFLLADLGLARFLFRVFGLAAHLHRFETGPGNCRPYLSLTHHRRHVLDAGVLSSNADLGLQYAFQFRQRLFETAGVVVVGEALDDQVRLAGRHAITGAFDAADQVTQPDGLRVEFYSSPLRGQVDDRRPNTFEFLETALDGGNAVGASHAGDGEG